jgi:hypothetical protein
VRQHYRGSVPQFAFNRTTQTMSKRGVLKRDAAGKLSFSDGYRVLVLIDDFGGNDHVAALY